MRARQLGACITFLETRFNIEDTSIRYWLKNDNEKEMKIWRYKHFYSHGDCIQKRSIITACLRKIQKLSSDDTAMIKSATHKLNEFTQLKYPRTTLKGICTFLAATSGNGAWISVRNQIQWTPRNGPKAGDILRKEVQIVDGSTSGFT